MTHPPRARARSRRRAAVALAVGSVLAASGAIASASANELPRRGQLGVSVAELDSANAERLAVDPSAGVWVYALAGRSPLRDAGVRVNDVITSLAGRPTPNVPVFGEVAGTLDAGDVVGVELLRMGNRLDAQVAVAEWPKERSGGLEIVYESFTTPDGVRLRAIVASTHEPADRRPAVLIVQDRVDGSIEPPGYGPARELALALARAGYVVMRFDRRGVGDSEGRSYRDLPFEGEQADLASALAYLRVRAGTDPDRTFIVAFGTGGVHAARFTPEQAAGIVCVAPPGRSLGTIVARTLRAELEGTAVEDSTLARIATLEAAETPVALVPLLPRDAAGRPLGRSEAYVAALAARPIAELFAVSAVPMALVVPGSDPVLDVSDAAAIVAQRRALGLESPDVIVVPETDAHLARASSPTASIQQRRMGLFAFSNDAADAIVRWLDGRARASAERPARP